MELERHVPRHVRAVPDRFRAVPVRALRDRLHLKPLSRHVLHPGQHHHRERVGVLRDGLLDLLRGERATVAHLHEPVRVAVEPQLRRHRVLVARESLLLNQDLIPLLGRSVERDE